MISNSVADELRLFDPSDEKFAIKVVDRLLSMAVERQASDMHLQPRDEGWEVMFRVDGVLTEPDSIAGGSSSDPVTRLMVLAGLPSYRSSQPMEGRIAWSNSKGRQVSMRLGIYPTIHGPRAVIRLLRREDKHESLAALGLPSDVYEKLLPLSIQTDGAVLLSGPAGSGKTTTMYAMLHEIAARKPRRSVVTIEDPVETVIPGISQSELDPSAGMTLASALRSAVRQDSEVLLVSEIRDPETAEAAMQASLTGHLVFSSLHATDVAASLRRLVNLGVPQFVVRSGIRAIVTQRLLRRLCSDCGRGSDAMAEAGEPCATCLNTGYRGRVVVADCICFDGTDPVGEALADSLAAGQSADQMRSEARRVGGGGLHQRAMQYVQDGITDEPEVFRVLGSGNAA